MNEETVDFSFIFNQVLPSLFFFVGLRTLQESGRWLAETFFLFSSSVPKKICLCLPRLEGGRGFRGLRHICSSVHLIRNAAANRNSPFPYPPPPPLQFYFPLDNDSCAPTRIAKKKTPPPFVSILPTVTGLFYRVSHWMAPLESGLFFFYRVFTEFRSTQSGCYGLGKGWYWLLLGFTGFYRVFTGF